MDGKGQYLTNVTVVPTKVKVFWGYDLAAQVNILKITNAGSAENPVGAIQLIVKWTLDSMVAHHERSAVFYMTGDGNFKQVSFN